MGIFHNSWYGFYNITGTYMDSVTQCHNTLRADNVKYESSLEFPWISIELIAYLSSYNTVMGKVFCNFRTFVRPQSIVCAYTSGSHTF